MKRVVAGIIIQNGRILLTQRGTEERNPFVWNTPGGKVEEGETDQAALARELQEEIGLIDCEIPDQHVFVARFGSWAVFFYKVDFLRGPIQPKLLEDAGLGWFSLQEFMALNLGPADSDARNAIAQVMLLAQDD